MNTTDAQLGFYNDISPERELFYLPLRDFAGKHLVRDENYGTRLDISLTRLPSLRPA